MNASMRALRLRWACALALLPLWLLPVAAGADPAQERGQLIAFFQRAFPDYTLDDYSYGAIMFRADARRQFDSIMEFPPFLDTIERGKRMWEKPFANGKRFADCFPDGGRNVAGSYPRHDAARDHVVTFEMAVNDCLRANGEAALALGDMNTLGVLMSYARTLSDGSRIDVRADSPQAQAKLAAGKRDFYQRRGQMNLSCANCHVDLAGRYMRDEIISPVLGQATHFPVFRRGGEELLTIQGYFRRCYSQVRATPPAIGGEAMNNLEYYHAYVSNGLPLRASVYRK